MSSPKFAGTHNVVAFLEKPTESDGFAEIIDFLKASFVRRKQRKEAEIDNAETEEEEHLNTPSNDPLPSGEDSMQLNDLMALCTQLQKQNVSSQLKLSSSSVSVLEFTSLDYLSR
ncbi:hypothetical protein Tco_1092734 [Tanacetum coccineum]|uniref:Uncharacterized protein n=1 Tax=Tanacetum coccineum TaxID=301880 RepID=A0ABQ5IAP7_9ASTR